MTASSTGTYASSSGAGGRTIVALLERTTTAIVCVADKVGAFLTRAVTVTVARPLSHRCEGYL